MSVLTDARATYASAVSGTNLSTNDIRWITSGSGLHTGTIWSGPTGFATANATIASAVGFATTQLAHVSFAAKVVAFAIIAVNSL